MTAHSAKKHHHACTCCECSPTPDMMPLAHKRDRFDRAEHGVLGRSNSPEIDHNALGPECHLDSAKGEIGRHGGHLGTGSDSVKEAGNSIPSGARAPKVNWGPLSRIRGGKA